MQSVKKKRKLLVCVEGPIGSGKSTLLEAMKALNKIGVVALEEPVGDWKSVEVNPGKNMLQAMYDGTLNSALFQLSILQSRFGPLVRALADDETDVVVSERSPWSEKWVFAKSNLTESEFACYNYAHTCLIRDLFPIVGEVDVIFYRLTLPTATILERIEQRGRVEEKGIEPAYLERLELAHDEMEEMLKSPRDLGCEEAIKSVKHVSVNVSGVGAEELAGMLLRTGFGRE